MNKHTWECVPVKYKQERTIVHRVPTPEEKVSFYNLIYQWNRRKTFKHFAYCISTNLSALIPYAVCVAS